MKDAQFHRNNHFVPCVYLKNFAGSSDGIFTYRTLVSRSDVMPWKKRSIRSVGYLSHLYTRIVAGGETDEFERWLDNEFEAPAAEPLRKAVSGSKLNSNDWSHLVRFLAAQIVRTPAFFVENLPRWQADVPGLLDSVVQQSVQALEAAKKSGRPLAIQETPKNDYLPLRVTAEPAEPGKNGGQLKTTITIGRGLWLFSMRSILTGSARVLHQHKWSILSPHEGLSWFTSDDPVIRLNYYDGGRYDFKAGINKQGAEILLPLGPQHLMYTKIGDRPPPRGETLTLTQTEVIRRAIAEHGYRMVFAASPEEDVCRFRPRIVNDKLFREEADRWQSWHADQTAAEFGTTGAGEPQS